jgi:hypothetical protein
MPKPTDMKKILCSFIFISFVFIADAQINKGSILLGGTVSSQSFKTESGTDTQKENLFVFTPAVGYAFKTNTVAGINLFYGHSKQGYVGFPTNQEIKSYGAGIFYRKYMNLSKKFYLFGEADAGYNYGKREQQYPSSSHSIEKINSFNLGVTPGLAFAVNRFIHLEASIANIISLQYQKSLKTYQGSSFPQPDIKSSGFAFEANANNSAPISIGIRFVLGR